MRIGSEDYEIIEPGTYPARVEEWTDTDQHGRPLMSMGFGDREPQPQWKIKFAIDVEGEERFLSAWVTQPADPDNVHPRAKIVSIAKACLGEEAETTDWDISDLVGRELRVQVEVYETKDGGQRNKIGAFYPPKRSAAPAPPQPAAQQRPRPAPARAPAASGAAPF